MTHDAAAEPGQGVEQHQRAAASLFERTIADTGRLAVAEEAALRSLSYEVISRGAAGRAARRDRVGQPSGPPPTTAERARHVADRLRATAFGLRTDVELVASGAPTTTVPRAAVWFLAHQPGHLADVEPLVPILASHDLGAVVLTDSPRVAEHTVPGAAVELVTCGRGDRARALAEATRLRFRLGRAARRAAHGPDDLAVVREIDDAARRLLPRAMTSATWVTQALASSPPAVLVAVNPYAAFGRTGLWTGRAHGVRTVALQHGSVSWSDPLWPAPVADSVLVWGEWSRDALAAAGIDPAAIEITGAPRFDVPRTRSHDAAGPVVVAVSGAGNKVSVAQHHAFLDLLAEAIGRTPGVRWIVKLHPKDDPALYRAAIDLGAADVEIIEGRHSATRGDIYDVLAGARALVTLTSTSALDAAVVGVPTIRVDIGGDDASDFVADLAQRRVATAAELATAVTSPSLGDTAALGAASSRHLAHRGEAAARTAAAITRRAGDAR